MLKMAEATMMVTRTPMTYLLVLIPSFFYNTVHIIIIFIYAKYLWSDLAPLVDVGSKALALQSHLGCRSHDYV